MNDGAYKDSLFLEGAWFSIPGPGLVVPAAPPAYEQGKAACQERQRCCGWLRDCSERDSGLVLSTAPDGRDIAG